ncbi:hypothetical protein MCEHALE4_00015 [Candidatus Planktophila dulcis]|jgi:hypothetical protein
MEEETGVHKEWTPASLLLIAVKLVGINYQLASIPAATSFIDLPSA